MGVNLMLQFDEARTKEGCLEGKSDALHPVFCSDAKESDYQSVLYKSLKPAL
jgi:hypothetical protein